MTEVATEWECPHCHTLNPPDSSICSKCLISLVRAGRNAVVEQHLQRAREFQQQRRLDQAIVQLLEASRADPQDFDVHMLLGSAYAEKNFLREAAACFEEAVRLKPDSARAHYALGQAYRSLNRLEEALAQFSLALQIDPDHAGARAARAELASVQREVVPEPEPRKKGEEKIEIKPRPLVGARTVSAGIVASAVGLGGAALVGVAFGLLTSPQLVEREHAFMQFVVPGMLVVWWLAGVACASVAAPILPLGGAAAGLLVGAVGPLIAGAVQGIAIPAWLLERAAAAGLVLTCGIELLSRGTFFGERRAFLFWGVVVAVVIFVAYRFLSHGSLSGRVVLSTAMDERGKPQGGAEVVLLSPGGYSYQTFSVNSEGGDAGRYAFTRVPAGVYSVAFRAPGSYRWQRETVNINFAVTAGTQMDLIIPDSGPQGAGD